jgi:hypothetical protein
VISKPRLVTDRCDVPSAKSLLALGAGSRGRDGCLAYAMANVETGGVGGEASEAVGT